MPLKNLLLIFVFSTSVASTLKAQNLNFIARGNISIGEEYRQIDYNGGTLLYSTGGGSGIEVGLQLDIKKGFAVQSTLGYQLHLALQAESVNGNSNKSSFNFSRTFFTFGAVKNFKISDGVINTLHLGAGCSINFPGDLKRIENDIELGKSTYNSSIGSYYELGLGVDISDNIVLNPSLRYRLLNFSADSFSEGSISDMPQYLQELNANGLELGLTMIKRINTGK